MIKLTPLRDRARQNLLVQTVNVALQRGLITLDCRPIQEATFEFVLAEQSVRLPVIANVHDAGHDEVVIKAIVCPTQSGRRFVGCTIFSEFKKFGAAIVRGWLERRTGKYLQSLGGYHGTRAMTQTLAELTITPNGFGTDPTKDGREFTAVFGPHKVWS